MKLNSIYSHSSFQFVSFEILQIHAGFINIFLKNIFFSSNLSVEYKMKPGHFVQIDY